MNREFDKLTFEPPTPEILDELELHVECRLRGHVRNFRVSTRDGGLVLNGRSGTYYAKQMAQQAVMDAMEWPIHANEIEVV